MRRYARDQEELEERVAAYLKAQIKAAGITYAQLVERLKRHGYANASLDSLKKKLMRGTFSAGFFLAVLAALDVTEISLAEI